MSGSGVTILLHGRLAQLVAHHFDIVGATGSSPVPSIYSTMKQAQSLIRAAESSDFAGIWEIFAAVVRDGDTYAYGPETTEEQARAIWMAPECALMFACTKQLKIMILLKGTLDPLAA